MRSVAHQTYAVQRWAQRKDFLDSSWVYLGLGYAFMGWSSNSLAVVPYMACYRTSALG